MPFNEVSSFIASIISMYSDSVVERATMDYNRDLQLMQDIHKANP